MYRFEQPELLWLLLLIPLFALMRGRKGKRPSISFPAVGLAKQVAAFVRSRPGRFRVSWRLLVLAFLVLALARPQRGNQTTEIETSGIDIVLAVDLSGSMDAHDFELKGKRTNRLEVAKTVIAEFIEKRPNDRIGMIAFAKDSYLISPLTLNHEWLNRNLKRLDLGLIDGSQTAIGDALAMSANRLRQQKAKSRIVVLLTDGASNAGKLSPEQAAEAAKAYGIKIYTIGAAVKGEAPYPARDRYGNLVKDSFGRQRWVSRPSDLDMETLEKVSKVTGGKSYRATSTKELEKIYEDIDRLEKTEIKLKYNALWKDLFYIPLLIGLGILLLEQLIVTLIHRRLP
ncbi:MAG: VWA domain-containing protein [Opitutales bacterium]|nr:VWA domain-containing protein [Opitutales bacterium]